MDRIESNEERRIEYVATRRALLPSPLWGGVGGGGRTDYPLNLLQHSIDIRQYVVVPETQDASLTKGLTNPRGCRRRMAAISCACRCRNSSAASAWPSIPAAQSPS